MFVGHINYARFWRGIRINLFLPSWCFNGSPDDMTYCLECAVASILQEIDETLCNEKFFPPVWSMRETVALFWISHKHFFWQWIEQHKMWLYCQALLFALFQTNREALDYSFEQQWQSSLSCLDKTHSISNFHQQWAWNVAIVSANYCHINTNIIKHLLSVSLLTLRLMMKGMHSTTHRNTCLNPYEKFALIKGPTSLLI